MISHVTGRPLWIWSDGNPDDPSASASHDQQHPQPRSGSSCSHYGGKSKSKTKKRRYHRAIQRGSEIIRVGDAAVFFSHDTAAKDEDGSSSSGGGSGADTRPYVGQVETLWETPWNGKMMTRVRWFYHPEEIEHKKYKLKVQVRRSKLFAQRFAINECQN